MAAAAPKRRWLSAADALDKRADEMEAKAERFRTAAIALREAHADDNPPKPKRRRKRQHLVETAPFGYKANGEPRKRPAPSSDTIARAHASRAANAARRNGEPVPA